MTWLDVAVHGIPDTAAVLTRIEEGVADLEPVVEELHRLFMAVEKSRFDAEGPGWAALAPSTLAEKRRKGLHEKILDATGAMRDSFINPDAPGHVFEVTVAPDLTTVEMGSDYRSPTQTGAWAGTALAALHQDGTDRMPARLVITGLDQHAAMWSALIAGWIHGAVTTA